MEYSIQKTAALAGVSTRTLRHYDDLGLLVPARVSSNGYRIYGRRELDRLQQILFYRELGVSLEEIKAILDAPDFDPERALASHLAALEAKRESLDALIRNVESTIRARRGEITMSDQEKFTGFKAKLVADNEAKYGGEVRAKYGEEMVARSNAKLMGLSEAQYMEAEELSRLVNERLQAALAEGNPAGATAQEACDLHRRWLSVYWPAYSKQAHKGLAQMYVDDPRFAEYYDKLGEGCSQFLRDAIFIYCAE